MHIYSVLSVDFLLIITTLSSGIDVFVVFYFRISSYATFSREFVESRRHSYALRTRPITHPRGSVGTRGSAAATKFTVPIFAVFDV